MRQPKAVAAAAAFLIMVCALLIPPVIGVADNGDFYRATNGLGIYKMDRYEADSFMNYASTKFGIYEYYNEYEDSIPSSQILFIKAALLLDNLFTGGDLIFDIRFLGALLIIYATIAIYLIADFVTFQRSRSEGYVLAAVCVFIFADTGYTAYFNSFFTEGLVYVSFLAAMASALLITQKRYSFSWLYASLLINSVIAISAKQQNATIGVVLCLMCLIMACFIPKEKRRRKAACALGGLSLMACGLVMYIIIPESYKNINQYHTMTRGVMMEAENPEEAADFFDIDRQYSILNETIYFERYPTVDAQGDVLEEGFYNKYSFFSVCAYYLTHPDALLRMLTDAAQEGYIIRPDMLGNYDRSEGKPPGTKTNFFVSYSNLKRAAAPTTVGFVLVWFLVMTAFHFKDRQRMFIVWCAILSGLIQVGTSVVGAGDTDLSKHVFVYNVAFDLVTYISLSPAILWIFHTISGIAAGIWGGLMSGRKKKGGPKTTV